MEGHHHEHHHDTGPDAAEESLWQMDDATAEDPEELLVKACALDSFL